MEMETALKLKLPVTREKLYKRLAALVEVTDFGSSAIGAMLMGAYEHEQDDQTSEDIRAIPRIGWLIEAIEEFQFLSAALDDYRSAKAAGDQEEATIVIDDWAADKGYIRPPGWKGE